jgi:hypothetical protein
MALVKCSECRAKVSTEAHSCPKCGAPVKVPVVSITLEKTKSQKPPKPMSLGKKIMYAGVGTCVLLSFFVDSNNIPIPVTAGSNNLSSSVANATTDKAIKIKNISGKTKEDVKKYLGDSLPCEKTKYGPSCKYRNGDIEIVYINKKADWITINAVHNTNYNSEILNTLDLEYAMPVVSNQNVMRWENIQGLLEVSVFPSTLGSSKCGYAYIKVKTE